MSQFLIAIVASLPGLLLGIAALMKAKRATPAVIAAMQATISLTRTELIEAKEKIEQLEERIDECDRERHKLVRENLELYRRVDKANET